ncbi:MAG: PstA family ABC transporter permease [Chloroflexota bacterium]
MDNLSEGAFVSLIRDNVGAVTDSTFVTDPMSITLSGRRFPDSMEVDADAATIRDITPEQQRDILIANTSRAQLLSWVNSEVVGLEILDSWTLSDTLFRRSSIYTDAADSQANDAVEKGLDTAGDVTASDEELTAAFAPMIGEENAAQLVANRDFTISVINQTDDQTGNNRWVQQAQEDIRAAFASTPADRLNEDQVRDDVIDDIAAGIAGELSAEIPQSAADEIGAEFAPAIVRETFDNFDDNEIEDLFTLLIKPPLAIAIEQGTYTDARLEFRSWLNQSFLTARGRNSIPAQASLRTAILGSVWVMIITMLTAFPLGVGAAIYLEEYANDNWLNRIIETNIRNLAGVPSIIYGILGLAIFVRALAPITSGQVFGFGGGTGGSIAATLITAIVIGALVTGGLLFSFSRQDAETRKSLSAEDRQKVEAEFRNRALTLAPVLFLVSFPLIFVITAIVLNTFGSGDGTGETLNGRTVLSAGLTLALLILPVIIINSQEAVRSVSSAIREASYGLGATKWQTIWRQILPIAVPGILTGSILAFSRAVGETAPLIVVGAATAINADPTNPFMVFTVIPIQIYDWTSRPQDQFRDIAAAAIIVLLFLLITLNTTAIILRNRFQKRLAG